MWFLFLGQSLPFLHLMREDLHQHHGGSHKTPCTGIFWIKFNLTHTCITPGEGTSYVGQYGMLGYTWVIFEKFSVLFPRDGYFFSTKFLYFFCKVGVHFEENFCICQFRCNPFARNFLYFISQRCCILHITYFCIFLQDRYLFKRLTVVVRTN